MIIAILMLTASMHGRSVRTEAPPEEREGPVRVGDDTAVAEVGGVDDGADRDVDNLHVPVGMDQRHERHLPRRQLSGVQSSSSATARSRRQVRSSSL